MEIKKCEISLKKYFAHIKKTLAKIPRDRKRVVIVLCRGCEDLSRLYKTAPVFAFTSSKKELAQTEILEWARKISQEKFHPPISKAQYLVARLSEEEYSSFLDADTCDEELNIAGRAVMGKFLAKWGL